MTLQSLFEPSIDALATLVEEGARANQRSTTRFIEPAQGTLRRAESRRHHIVFGRRGSGKSSLLYKSAEDLTSKGRPVAYVDLEPFKGHHYPDVLLSVLLAVHIRLYQWLETNTQMSRRWWTLWFIDRNNRDRATKRGDLMRDIERAIGELEKELHLSDGAALSLKDASTSKEEEQSGLKTGVGTKPGPEAKMELSLSQSLQRTRSREVSESYIRSKQDWLHRKIIDFQKTFRELSELTNGDCYIFLDDLYHIYRTDQAALLDYFHRVVKGNSVWLKVGTIKNRSTWYIHSPQPTGLKLGDDAEEINLDLTLEKFSVSKEFLRNILRLYIEESAAPALDDLVADGGFDRLVLASGGVTRDFLGLFRRSIDEARERLTRNREHARGEKIGAEDVNIAAGSYGEVKKEEFQRDTLEDRQNLENAFLKVRLFCIEKTKKNVFLVDQDLKDAESDRVQELIDLRLLHHIRSRVTVSDRPGKIFRALLLDVSQYTGERMRRDVEMVEFWKDSNKEGLRKTSLIYDPTRSIEELQQEIHYEEQRKPYLDNKQMNLPGT